MIVFDAFLGLGVTEVVIGQDALELGKTYVLYYPEGEQDGRALTPDRISNYNVYFEEAPWAMDIKYYGKKWGFRYLA